MVSEGGWQVVPQLVLLGVTLSPQLPELSPSPSPHSLVLTSWPHREISSSCGLTD